MLENDWIERNGSAGLAGALAWGAWSLSAGAWPPESAPGLHGAFFALATVAVFGNQLHYWAHLRRPPAPVRWLQRAGLFLSPRRHARHHRAPHTGGYCIATGWANPLLDALGFWRALERAVTAVTGTPPRARGAKRENEYA